MAPSRVMPTYEFLFTLKQLRYLYSLFTDFILLYGIVTNELMTSETVAMYNHKENILPILYECE